MSDLLLEAVDVSKRFKGVLALDSSTISVASGESVGIIGPNGAGKTTLFNLIAGALRPTTGSVAFRGRTITRLPAHRRVRLGLARTFQLTRPFRSLTVAENLIVSATASGSSIGDARTRVAEVLKTLGMRAIADRSASQLNAVEAKRLEVGRALATSPVLVLLDEIFSGLSRDEVDDLISVVHDLPRRGLTVLLIEHNVHAIRSVAERVIALDSGRVISTGSASEVLDDPAVKESYLGRRTPA